MPHKIETHGWNDLIIPTEALFELGSRAYKLFGYLVFRARDKDNAYPSQKRVAEDLTTDDEKWSGPTAKRAFAELVAKEWIIRERRVGTSSMTHIFKSPELCREYKRRIMDDPIVGSQMIPQSDHGRSEKEDSDIKKDSSNGTGVKKKTRKPDPFFNAICEVCGLDPYRLPPGVKGSGVATVKKSLIEAKWIPQDVLDYHRWRKNNNQGPLGSIWWLVTEMAKREWREGASASVDRNKGSMTDEQREAHERYMAQRRGES